VIVEILQWYMLATDEELRVADAYEVLLLIE
jgi:hypothetical protein